jgi:hypothetical protein
LLHRVGTIPCRLSEAASWRPVCYRWVGTARFCVQERCFFPIFASFDTAPSPHRRINAPSLLLAFAHTQGEAETPTEGVGSAVVGRNSPVLCAGGVLFPCKMTPFSPRSTPPRLRTGESMHLVCFWPSPTPRARRKRQRRASGVRWWVGTARFCVQEGCFFRESVK